MVPDLQSTITIVNESYLAVMLTLWLQYIELLNQNKHADKDIWFSTPTGFMLQNYGVALFIKFLLSHGGTYPASSHDKTQHIAGYCLLYAETTTGGIYPNKSARYPQLHE